MKGRYVEGGGKEIFAFLTNIVEDSGAKGLEVGFILDGEDQEREPEPEESVTWWASIEMPDGTIHRGECRTSDHEKGAIQALVEAIREGGGRVMVLEIDKDK